MTDFLEFTVDKFTFKVATDRFYSAAGLWAKEDSGRVRIGLSDFLQQRSGDVAFAEIAQPGEEIAYDQELAVIETIKVDIILPSPVTGTVIDVNPVMDSEPEIINEDPYDGGWLATVATADWPADQARLMEPQAYLNQIVAEAEEEAKYR